jgi:hypothetical protein
MARNRHRLALSDAPFDRKAIRHDHNGCGMGAKIIAFPKSSRSALSLWAIRAIEAIVRIDARYRGTDLEAGVTRELQSLVIVLERLGCDGDRD